MIAGVGFAKALRVRHVPYRFRVSRDTKAMRERIILQNTSCKTETEQLK